MPEHIRAFVYVILLSAVMLYAARPALIQVVPAKTYDRWRVLWLFTSSAWFLAGNVWVFFALMVVALTKVRKKEPQIFGLYLLLLFAAPSAYVPIPGFGVIDHVIMLDHYRLLALTLLLPAAWRLMQSRDTLKFGRSPVDWMVAGYLMLTWALSAPDNTITNAARAGVLQIIDGFLPYYVASRSIRSAEDFRIAMSGLLLGALLVSIISVFEVFRSWKVYSASIVEYGLQLAPHYKTRGPFLRPGASIQDSIVIGAVVVIAMCVLLYLKSQITGKFKAGILWLTLALGVIASLSRAPWMASILIFFIFFALEGKITKTMVKGTVLVFLGGVLLSFFPAGKIILDLLPFIGETEQGSIDYRMNWFSASLPVIERGFWFGNTEALAAPELEIMRNGEGIIDLVNMFLAVLLYYGVVGLALFMGMFLGSLKAVRRSERHYRKHSPELGALGRALIAAILSFMLIISTLSAISVVPIMLWTLVGASTAYAFLKTSLTESPTRPVPVPVPRSE